MCDILKDKVGVFFSRNLTGLILK